MGDVFIFIILYIGPEQDENMNTLTHRHMNTCFCTQQSPTPGTVLGRQTRRADRRDEDGHEFRAKSVNINY